MRRAIALAVALVLASVWARAEPPASGTGVDGGDVTAALHDYVAEQHESLPELSERVRAAAAQARLFEHYLRRMRADAAAQRAVLALGNLRPPALSQAQRNWRGWEVVVREHLAGATAAAKTARHARRDEEDRWVLLAGDGDAALPPALVEAYTKAQELRARKLELLGRLEQLGEQGKKNATKALDICAGVEKAIVRTAERLRARFLWTRIGLTKLPATIDDLRVDLQLIMAPLRQAAQTQWLAALGTVLLANWVAGLTTVLVVLVLLGRARFLKTRLRLLISRVGWTEGLPRRLIIAAASALSRSLVSAVLGGVALATRLSFSAYLPGWSQPILGLLIALSAWRLLDSFLAAVFDPEQPAPSMSTAAVAALRRSARGAGRWLVTAWGAAVLVRDAGLTAVPSMLLFVLLELLALRSLHGLFSDERLAESRLAAGPASLARRWRLVVRVAVLVMLGLTGVGFVNLAWHVGWSMLKSTLVLAVLVLVWALGVEPLRRRTGELDAQATAPLLSAWKVIVGAVGFGTIPFLWGFESFVAGVARQVLALGVDVGDQRLTLLRVIAAALCILGAWVGGRVVGGLLARRIVSIDVGVRTAVVTSVKYALIAAGALAAVRTLGFDLTNLAIMAGALGVGIGFGLQMLVSNFVSGLIILFERPFKIGDVLEHEGVYGYVRRIRTRSTILRTFDEAEIVLPNAELLAQKITNWTLTDNRARAILTVGVAYGSDVARVRDTLYRVGKQHPLVLQEPRVLFSAFGDSALEFRLMVWVDIRERIQVLSDLHFAIDAAFREAGIQIPFPQRDVRFYPAASPGQ